MSLDSDSTKRGLNAIARAHNIINELPDLLKLVKAQTSNPGWALAASVHRIEDQLQVTDAQALNELHAALSARSTP
jgi:hypothetical protein